jgi:hypothetical protein
MGKRSIRQHWFSAPAIALALSIPPLMIVAPGSSLAQETPAKETEEPKEGLTKGIPIPADKDLLEGTWSALHILTKEHTWKRSGTVQIQKDEETKKLLAKWADNGGGDDPKWNQGPDEVKPRNEVTFSGTEVTLHRKLQEFDVKGGSNAQTWEGTLYKGKSGNIEIEGHVSGAWINWEKTNGNGDEFKLVKQVTKPSH